MKFRLGCNNYLVTGAENGCIYDLEAGKLIEIDKEVASVLIELENGKDLEEIDKAYKGIIESLINKDIGRTYNNNVYIDKLRHGMPRSVTGFMLRNIRINSLYIQLDTECDMDCHFCSEDDFINRKTGCKKFENRNEERLSVEEYEEILINAYKLGCRSVFLLGGEPLLSKRIVLEVSELANKMGYTDIFLYTNLLLLDDDFLKENRNIIKYIIHGIAHNQETMDIMGNKKINFSTYENNILLLRKYNIPYYFNICISNRNYKFMDLLFEYFKSLEPVGFVSDFIYETTEDTEYNEVIENNVISDLNINEYQFVNNLEHHPCMYGKITIFLNGDVGVCPMMREDIIGNIKEVSLAKILGKKKQNKYWNMKLDELEKCSKCSYRYGCKDCRAIEKSNTNDLYGKKYCYK